MRTFCIWMAKITRNLFVVLKNNIDAWAVCLLTPLFFALSFLSANSKNVDTLSTNDITGVMLVSFLVLGISLAESIIAKYGLNIIRISVQFRIILFGFIISNFLAGYLLRIVAEVTNNSADSNRLFLIVVIATYLLVFVIGHMGSKLLDSAKVRRMYRALAFGGIFICLFSVLTLTSNIHSRSPSSVSQPTDIETLRKQGYFEWHDLSKIGLDIESAKKTVGKYDIYYILLDGYPNFDVLEEVYGLNNGTEQFLKNRGFYVADESRTNYQETFLALPALLRMQYIHEDLYRRFGESGDESLPRSWLKQNETIQFYKNSGYRFASISPWAGTDASSYDDFTFESPGQRILNLFGTSTEITEVTEQFSKNNILKPINRYIEGENVGLGSIATLELAGDIPKDPSSTFSYIYSWLPHTPNYFDENGNPVTDPYAIEPDGRKHWGHPLFTKNVEAIDKPLQDLVDKILEADSPQEPVILIASDHGTANLYDKYKYKLDSTTLEEGINERYKNLTAFYFPNGDYGDLEKADKISLVNLGKYIANKFVGQELEYEESRAYYSERYYKFRDVTDVVW